MATVGNPAPRHVAHATRVLGALPPVVLPAARDARTDGALPSGRSSRTGIRSGARYSSRRSPTRRSAARWSGWRRRSWASREDRLSVLDLALPALDGLATDAAAALERDLAALALADGRTTVFEWAVLSIVRRRRVRRLGPGARPARLRVLDEVQEDLLDVLSTLAWGGTRDPAAAQAALKAALPVVGIAARWKVLPRDRVSARRLDAALDRLDGRSRRSRRGSSRRAPRRSCATGASRRWRASCSARSPLRSASPFRRWRRSGSARGRAARRGWRRGAQLRAGVDVVLDVDLDLVLNFDLDLDVDLD